MSMTGRSWTADLLVYAHIGDLHIVDREQPNYEDLLAIVSDVDTLCDVIDFIYLPGDNADNGTDAQYALVAEALKPLRVPVHVITGDHDMETGSLDPFYASLAARRLPYVETIRGIDCIFLDMCGSGRGGPDFRLPAAQTDVLRRGIDDARTNARRVVVFMHTYPADMVDSVERETINALLADPIVSLVDMGHTHYNEIANDGRTIFTATRSTGQIEEGPVGYSIAAVDNGVVSWRFRLLDDATPVVLITSPSDMRLKMSTTGNKTLTEIHAVVAGARGEVQCEWRSDDGDWRPMTRTPNGRGYEAHLNAGATRERLEVRAIDATGSVGSDIIDIKAGDARAFVGEGSDRDTIGAWEGRHLFGTQLGPNRNGRKW